MKSQFQSEEVIFESEELKLRHKNEQKNSLH